MLKNPFRTDPVHVIKWDKKDKTEGKNDKWTSTRIVLLGQQPPEIRSALTRALAQFNRGKVADSAVLRRYFGPAWRESVGLGKMKSGGCMYEENSGTFGGDAADGDLHYGNDPSQGVSDTEFTSLPQSSVGEREPSARAMSPEQPEPAVDEVETLEIIDTEHPADISPDVNSEITVHDLVINLEDLGQKPRPVRKAGAVQFVYDVDIYPEDKVSEFKLKLSNYFEIPPFRQHLWYTTAGQSFPMSYNFLQGGAAQHVDMHSIIEAGDVERICDMPVNMFLYRNKDTIKIEAYDNFTLLGNIYQRNGVKEFHIVDLETYVGPYRNELTEISKSDKYQLQVLFYGFVTKFWPQMNLAAFVEYLEERHLSQSYPQLEPNKDELGYLAKQQTLMRELYTLYEGDENRVRRIDQTLQKSLTETTLKVVSSSKGKMLNLRVLFDIFTLDDKVNAMRLYDQVEGKPIMLDKYLTGGRASQEKLIPGVLYFSVIVSEQPRQQLKLFLYPNGAYAIKGVWGEDQNYEFADVNLLVDKHINPIIRRVNSFSSQVMYHGSTVRVPEAEKSNAKFIDISISMFWKKLLTTGEFRQLKGILDQFVAAHIIQEKQVDRNTVSYFFKRGMYEFDPRRIEKSAVVDNYYAYLFNSDIRQKWFMLFENIRVMTVTHRFSDVKVEISGIKEDEYYIFIRYIVLLMSQFMRDRGTTAPKDEARAVTKPLSNLKEQDPHLYNFKKLYNSELVYSKLCQKPYQPNLLTQAQYDGLDKKAKEATTKYWNFTTNTDAYYQCPNPKFPHVRFIVGKHPMGFCIPCCKITAPPTNPNDKQRQIYDKCIREHTYEKRDVERSTSRYIMSYGKPIDIGRLSHLPETSLEPLFYETKVEDQGHPATEEESDELIGAKYYLYGVPQSHPSAKHCGLLYCFSHAMGMNIEALVSLICSKLEKHSSNFQMLLNGTITQWFRTPTELVTAFRTTFLTNAKLPTVKTKTEKQKSKTADSGDAREGPEFTRWNALVQDIALQFLEICTIAFEDRDTVIQLRLPDYLDNIEDIQYPKHMHMIVLHNLATDYWNPIYILHKDLYFRAGIIDRKLFAFQSDAVQLIMEMVRNKTKEERQTTRLTYDVLRKFIAQSSRYTIERILVTRDNLCYGVHVDPVGYVPVHFSHFKWDEQQSVSFRSADIRPASAQRLHEFCQRYNNWVAEESRKGGFMKVDVPVTRPLLERIEPVHPLMVPERWLVMGEVGSGSARAIAWRAHNLNFYIEPLAQSAALKLARAPLQALSYNPIEVNGVLERASHGALAPAPDRRTELVDHALYRNYLYQLLVLEFIQMFNSQRNTKVREQLKRLFLKTDFKQPTNELIQKVQSAVLQGFDRNVMLLADVEKIKTQIVEWLLSGTPKKELMRAVDSEYYNFDMVMLERLKKMPRKQIHEQLRKLAGQFVEIGNVETRNFRFPNLLTSCQGSDKNAGISPPGYCSRGRLVISRKDLDRYLEVLADQIKNPFVEKYLFSPLFQTSMIDYFQFKRVPGEIIEIEFL
jgi:hypothetical protein